MSARMSWDEFQKAHDVTEPEEPAAFAAYLHYLSDGDWNSDVRDVAAVPDEDADASAG